MRKVIATLAITLAVLLLGGLIFIYSGIYNVGADDGEGPVLSWILHTTMENSVKRRAGDLEVPDLDDTDLIARGAGEYDEMCVMCHGAPGVEPADFAQGLSPHPPELVEEAEEHDGIPEAAFFWITKHGIQMTGMPAVGETHDDEDIWAMIALIRRFDKMSPAEYQEWVETARQKGHQHDGEGHAHTGESSDEPPHGGVPSADEPTSPTGEPKDAPQQADDEAPEPRGGDDDAPPGAN